MRVYGLKNKDGKISWGVDYRNPVTGQRIVQIIGTNKKQAADALAKVRQEMVLFRSYGEKEYFERANNIVEDISFGEMTQKYLEHARVEKKSADRDRRSLETLGNYLVPPGRKTRLVDMRLSAITEKIIEDYKRERIKQIKCVSKDLLEKKYIKPATVNREMSCLKHMMNLAVRWKYAYHNPVRNVKLFKENNARVKCLEQSQIDSLLGACDSMKKATYLKPIIIVAINTGMRKGEILRLKWKDVDFSNGLLYISISKNGESGYIPMNSTVQKTLKDLRPASNKANDDILSEYVFKFRGKLLKDIRTAFEETLRRAGISDFVFHDLRHVFASHLVMNGIDLVSVKELLRHKTIAMTMRYAHLDPKHKMEAVETLYKKKDVRNLQDLEGEQKLENRKPL